jgi:hypothetical protein
MTWDKRLNTHEVGKSEVTTAGEEDVTESRELGRQQGHVEGFVDAPCRVGIIASMMPLLLTMQSTARGLRVDNRWSPWLPRSSGGTHSSAVNTRCGAQRAPPRADCCPELCSAATIAGEPCDSILSAALGPRCTLRILAAICIDTAAWIVDGRTLDWHQSVAQQTVMWSSKREEGQGGRRCLDALPSEVAGVCIPDRPRRLHETVNGSRAHSSSAPAPASRILRGCRPQLHA